MESINRFDVTWKLTISQEFNLLTENEQKKLLDSIAEYISHYGELHGIVHYEDEEEDEDLEGE